MRCVLALVLLSGCGRFNFDASSSTPGDDAALPDSPDPDGSTAALVIIAPPADAEVGPAAELVGSCAAGTVTITGDLLEPVNATCNNGSFLAELEFSSGFGTKTITVTQNGDSVMRTFTRIPQTPTPFAASSGATVSQGPAVNCNLVIPRPAGAEGQLMLGMIYTDGGTEAAVETPDWTRLSLDGATFVAFFKFFEPGDPEQFEFPIVAGTSITDTCASAGVLVGIKNVDRANPIMAQSAISNSFASDVTTPEVTTTMETRIFGVFGSNGPGTGIAGPIGMELDGDAMPNGSVAQSADDSANALIVFQVVGAGATGTRTATIATDAGIAGGLIALTPL